MHLLKVAHQSMHHMKVLAVAATRCRSSAECKTQSEMELSTSTKIVLLKNGVLNIVPCVQNKIFKLKCISFKLSWCLLTRASWNSS